jgi:ATP-dependent Clp protease adaptor protein ClpS
MSAKPGVVEETEVRETDATERTDGWIVTVYDNEHNTYQEVIAILMIATQCSADEAFIETWEVDHLGKSVVHSGSQDVCSSVAKVIATIGIRVEVSQE